MGRNKHKGYVVTLEVEKGREEGRTEGKEAMWKSPRCQEAIFVLMPPYMLKNNSYKSSAMSTKIRKDLDVSLFLGMQLKGLSLASSIN